MVRDYTRICTWKKSPEPRRLACRPKFSVPVGLEISDPLCCFARLLAASPFNSPRNARDVLFIARKPNSTPFSSNAGPQMFAKNPVEYPQNIPKKQRKRVLESPALLFISTASLTVSNNKKGVWFKRGVRCFLLRAASEFPPILSRVHQGDEKAGLCLAELLLTQRQQPFHLFWSTYFGVALIHTSSTSATLSPILEYLFWSSADTYQLNVSNPFTYFGVPILE